MKLSIYSLKRILFQGRADLLNCKTPMGEITILDNHQTLISLLSKGTLRVIEVLENREKKERFFSIKSGFLEVRKNNEVRCLVEE